MVVDVACCAGGELRRRRPTEGASRSRFAELAKEQLCPVTLRLT